MNHKKILIILSVLAALLVGVGLVGAQDATPEPSAKHPRMDAIRDVIAIVAEETGLTTDAIVEQLRQGMTLADIITANSGDVQSVIDQSVAKLTEDINNAVANGQITQQRADRLLNNLQDVVTKGINGELFPNRLDRGQVARQGERILLQAVAQETGLRPAQILEQMAGGKTLAEVITANGGNVDNVVNAAVTEATTQINDAVVNGRIAQEQADELIGSLQTFFTNLVNGEFRRQAAEVRIAIGVLRLAAEQTGLTVEQIRQELNDGKTLAQILTEHNVDTNAFIDAAVAQLKDRLDKAVANGRITQADADQRLAQFHDRLTERINQKLTPAPEGAPA